MQRFATKDQQHDHRRQHRSGGQHRSRHGLSNRHVDHLRQRFTDHTRYIFTYTVVGHDRIVDREPDDGEQRSDDIQINTHSEEGQNADRQNHVVEERNDRTNAEAEFEARCDIGHDRHQAQQNGD